MKVDLTVKFDGIDLVNDVITAVDGVNLAQSEMPLNFVLSRPDYQLLTDLIDGAKRLTLEVSEVGLYTIEVNGNNIIPASEFVGGRPPVKTR